MKDVYHHLESFGLNTRDKVRQRVSEFSEKDLAKFLDSYLRIVEKRPLTVPSKPGAIDIFPDSIYPQMEIEMIMQLAMYANRIYVHDRLLSAIQFWNDLELPHYLIKYATRQERVDAFRPALIYQLEQLLQLRPLADAGIVYLTPAQIKVPKRDPDGLYVDNFYGPDGSMVDKLGLSIPEIPSVFVDYCDKHLQVYPAGFVDGEPTIFDGELTPRNMVAVEFDGDMFRKWYHLFESQVIEGESQQIANLFDFTGQRPVNPDTFRNWVSGVKRQTLEERMQHLHVDLMVSAAANARFVTNLPTSRDLATLDPDHPNTSLDASTVNALLKLKLPFIDDIDLNSIVKARQNEIAFEEFRLALDRSFRQIEALPESAEYQAEIEQIYRDLLVVPLAKVDAQMKALRRNLFINGSIVLGSLVGTILSKGNSLAYVALVYALTEALKMYKDNKAEEDKVKQLPSFFYWQVTRGKR